MNRIVSAWVLLPVALDCFCSATLVATVPARWNCRPGGAPDLGELRGQPVHDVLRRHQAEAGDVRLGEQLHCVPVLGGPDVLHRLDQRDPLRRSGQPAERLACRPP